MAENNDKWETSVELTAGIVPNTRESLWQKILQDRYSSGFIAGIIALIMPLIWNNISKFILGFSELTFIDFAAALIYGRFIQNTLRIHLWTIRSRFLAWTFGNKFCFFPETYKR